MAQNKDSVAYLGPKASYTHQAALDRFPETEHELVPQTTIEDVFASVQSGQVKQGVVPFENSSNGSVVFTLDLFADPTGKYPDILVCGEIYLLVHHCLLGHAANSSFSDKSTSNGTATDGEGTTSPAKPLYDLSSVKKLYSHPQAWGQCNIFLSKYLKGIERLDVSSTSKAAEVVAQDTTGASAAISSRVAGDLNGLEVLGENIEDKAGNSTRFFVLRRKDDQTFVAADGEANENETRYKTLVSFTVAHGETGALADCLAVFKKYPDHFIHTSNAKPC
ncbi:prephenate dehydratase [Recurvomyces mirabilis]|uniref:prephenate dehydratase n=1 Tax=Recurvomyces mirabilis TaxID=574656 RepID=A0AAE0WRG1_9PEZI|nr:prephenate dehydratase [Recurvomyces mirabilis]KAK5154895.1 prephenate dehydratase [Recurvomyces mirabilis]